jgi:hypothetical protein
MNDTTAAPATVVKKSKPWQRLLPLLITAACFGYLYTRLSRGAATEGSTLLSYLAKSFENVNWYYWLALMIPYCFFYLIFDSLVIWSVINWFNVKIRYADILPIRANAYILSLVNEQVSKGAIALYLNRRDGVPGWEIGSTMLFTMFCEFYSLILWATAGILLRWNSFPEAFHFIPWIALGAAIFFGIFHLFFSGKISTGQNLALCGCDRVARAASDRRGCSVYAGTGALWGLGQPRADAGLPSGDFFWSGGPRTDALRGDSFLGLALSRKAGPDDCLRIRHAQFLHLL